MRKTSLKELLTFSTTGNTSHISGFVHFALLTSQLALLLFFPLTTIGQKNPFYIPHRIPDRDSLVSILNSNKDELLLMEAYRELGFSYYENKRDSALMYFEKIILLAKKYDRKLWEADASTSIGFISYTQGNYPRSLQFLLQAKSIAENEQSERNTWSPSDQTKLSPAQARMTILARVHLHLGSLYGFTGNFRDHADLEFFHYNEAMRMALSLGDKVQQSIVNMNIARHYLNAGQPDSTLYFEKIALALIAGTGYTRYKGSVLLNTGNAYKRQNQYGLAKENYWAAVRVSLDINNLRSLGDTYLAQSNLCRELGEIDSSLYYGKKALETYQITSVPSGIADSYSAVSAAYQLKNQIDSAFSYQALAMRTRENLSADEKIRQFQNLNFDEQLRLQQLEKERNRLQNRIMTWSLVAGISVFMLIAFILLRNNRIRRKANMLLQEQKAELQHTLSELKTTQAQLVQSEKMASLGELTAGIAHEIQNPLNFVNNFSDVSEELMGELVHEMKSGNAGEAEQIAADITQNLQKISHHGKRADAIVKGMLQHSRSGTGQKEPTDINALADEYLRLSYHGLRAKDNSFNAVFKTDYDKNIGRINIIPQDIGRVILNLVANAFYTVNEKKKVLGDDYEPIVSLTTKKVGNTVEMKIVDNGKGISPKMVDKIFQPFFTTKPPGQGTGLGLSLAYDIVKAHGGEIKVSSTADEGTTFIIILPYTINNE